MRTARRLSCLLVRYLMALLATKLAAQNDGMLSVPLMGRDACIMNRSMNVYCQTELNVCCCTITLVEKRNYALLWFLIKQYVQQNRDSRNQ